MELLPTPYLPKPESPPHKDAPLMIKARALEASFLSEMLSYTGLGDPGESVFSGGIGEQQFASFLRDKQAELMVAKGGIGLAETLFQTMIKGARS